MKYITTVFADFINENMYYENFFITYNNDKFVYHITSENNAIDILKNGFKTGHELGVAEKRKAVYFSDKDVNYGIYARNKEGELYDGQNIGEVEVNLKGLKLLNMTYKNLNGFINHKLYQSFNVKGELDKIPHDIDGTISFLKDGGIYEVALKKDVANKLIEKHPYINESLSNSVWFHGSDKNVKKFLFSLIGKNSERISNYYGYGIYFIDNIKSAEKYGSKIIKVIIDNKSDILKDKITPEQLLKIYDQLQKENISISDDDFFLNPTYGKYSVLTDVMEFYEYIQRAYRDSFTHEKDISEFLLRSGIDGMEVTNDINDNILIVFNEDIIQIVNI